MHTVVTILSPMKRGLKVFLTPSQPIDQRLVTILSPMKRGLKAHYNRPRRVLRHQLQSYPR